MSWIRKTSTLPTSGTNELQTITTSGTITGGTFQLKFGSQTSPAITWSSTNATLLSRLQTALDTLFGSGNTLAALGTITAGIGTLTVTFQGSLGAYPMAYTMTTLSALTGSGAAVAVAQTTPGVAATNRGAAPGEQLVYTGGTYPVVYTNVSNTAFAPVWKEQATANALTAHAGGGQGSALALAAKVNRVTTVGTAGDSVKLPAAKAGAQMTVINAAAANAMDVFPATGEFINALSANTALSVAANKTAIFICAVDGTWNSVVTA